MELVSLAGELLQSAAEHAASYSMGQTALRYLDRALRVVEKCARWAVPPPLDQDERPQPELVRPLPWVFFLALLIVLRVTRESISLANLIMGKPPLRSADVVIFIQGRRRYLRTLKYQGNRMMRARTSTAHAPEPWYQRLHSLFQFTMCFRNPRHYGNNNTTSVSNNDEVLVVKRSKRGRQETGGSAGGATSSGASGASVESTMERLIEKMMLDLQSDDDSSFTLTNMTSPKSDRSEFTIESDQDATFQNETTNNSEPTTPDNTKITDDKFSPIKNGTSTPGKKDSPPTEENNADKNKENDKENREEIHKENNEEIHKENNKVNNKENKEEMNKENKEKMNKENKEEINKENKEEINKENKEEINKENKEEINKENSEENNKRNKGNNAVKSNDNKAENNLGNLPQEVSPKQESLNFIQNEITHYVQRTPKNEKIANGRTSKSVPTKNKASHNQRRGKDVAIARIASGNTSF